MSFKNILSVAALAGIVSAGSAHAGPTNLVQEPGFSGETPNNYCCSSTSPWVNGGSYSGGSLHGIASLTNPNTILGSGPALFGYDDVNIISNGTNAAPGNNFYASDGGANYQTAILYQNISGLTVGQKYELTFDEAFADEGGSATNPTALTGSSAQWLVNFGGNTASFSSLNGPLGNANTSGAGGTTQYGPDVAIENGGNDWQQVTMFFTATGTSEALAFESVGAGSPPFALLDNVSLTAVPEPATWATLILGLFGIGFVARRRRTAALTTA